MASTNKTANLSLNQWVPTDPVLMEDMNEDNRKLDAALGAQPLVRLMDVTVTTSAKTVELNLSGIKLSDYVSLRLYQITNYFEPSVIFRINKLTTSYQYLNSSNNWQDCNGFVYISGGYVDFDLCSKILYMESSQRVTKVLDSFNPSQLSTIDLMENGNANLDFPLGTRFILWGVKA